MYCILLLYNFPRYYTLYRNNSSLTGLDLSSIQSFCFVISIRLLIWCGKLELFSLSRWITVAFIINMEVKLSITLVAIVLKWQTIASWMVYWLTLIQHISNNWILCNARALSLFPTPIHTFIHSTRLIHCLPFHYIVVLLTCGKSTSVEWS